MLQAVQLPAEVIDSRLHLVRTNYKASGFKLNPEAFFYLRNIHKPHYSDLCRDIRYRYHILLISLTFLNITSDCVSILKSDPFKQTIPAFDGFFQTALKKQQYISQLIYI